MSTNHVDWYSRDLAEKVFARAQNGLVQTSRPLHMASLLDLVPDENERESITTVCPSGQCEIVFRRRLKELVESNS